MLGGVDGRGPVWSLNLGNGGLLMQEGGQALLTHEKKARALGAVGVAGSGSNDKKYVNKAVADAWTAKAFPFISQGPKNLPQFKTPQLGTKEAKHTQTPTATHAATPISTILLGVYAACVTMFAIWQAASLSFCPPPPPRSQLSKRATPEAANAHGGNASIPVSVGLAPL